MASRSQLKWMGKTNSGVYGGWTCEECGTNSKPPGSQNPKYCSKCRSEKAKNRTRVSGKYYSETDCATCGKVFTPEKSNIKNCDDCRVLSNSGVSRSQGLFGKTPIIGQSDASMVDCKVCSNYAYSKSPESGTCFSCWTRLQKEAKAELIKLIKPPYKIISHEGKPTVVKSMGQGSTYFELLDNLKESGMYDVIKDTITEQNN
ncbi:RNA polymerase sigma-E factor precursor [Bacillus phage vB_BceM-HSE3]|nr:RNA polymerase sigma-E factor precursor [Bacillus phage vB_BceM-HSE3]